jgi:hypothetical protein
MAQWGLYFVTMKGWVAINLALIAFGLPIAAQGTDKAPMCVSSHNVPALT